MVTVKTQITWVAVAPASFDGQLIRRLRVGGFDPPSGYVIFGYLEYHKPPPLKMRGFLFLASPPPRSLHVSEPCLTVQKRPGPTAQTLHRSRTRCTLRKREISLEVLSPLRFMVRQQSIRINFICPIYHSRDCYRSILPMYRRDVQSLQPRERGMGKVGIHGPHYAHVLACDGFHCNDPRYSIHFPYR